MAGRADAWAQEFERFLRALIASIDGPAKALWNSEMLAEDVDAFWTSVEAMQTRLVELLRFAYDWKTARRESDSKRMMQDDEEWTGLCESCV